MYIYTPFLLCTDCVTINFIVYLYRKGQRSSTFGKRILSDAFFFFFISNTNRNCRNLNLADRKAIAIIVAFLYIGFVEKRTLYKKLK